MNIFDPMDITSVIVRLAVVAGILLATFIIARLLNALIRKGLKPVPPLVADQVARWFSIFIWLTGILLAINQLGLNLDILLLLIGLAGIAAIVASRDVLTNFVSRYFLGIYIPVKTGDDVQVAGFKGRVVEINQVTTLLLDDEGSIITVPNSVFIREICVNKTSLAPQRITIPVVIPSKVSLPKAEAELLKLAYKYKRHLDPRFPPVFTIRNRGSSSVEAEMDLIVAKPELREALASELASKFREALDKLAREEGE